jgi:hypothetical protein
MKHNIKTQSVGAGVAKTNPVSLSGTPETKIQFHPMVHGKGVSGSIVKFKKDRKRDWKTLRHSDFKSHALSPMEKVEIPMSTESLTKLVEEIDSRQNIVKDGVKYGNHEYITVEKNKVIVIDDHNKKELLEQILQKGYTDDFWNLLTDADPDLADKLSAGHVQMQRRKTVYELKDRLTKNFPETTGSDSWQRWIFNNNWLFGSNYQEPIEKQKINILGVMPDYLFPTIDRFVDILEIKLPIDEVLVIDSDHKGAWKWTAQTNTAIGQVVNYLSEIDRLKLEIEKNIKAEYKKEISLLKPRAFILIGNSEKWDSTKREALRKLNHSLHGIEVITYFDLVQRGETFISSPVAGVVKEGKDSDMPF